MLLLEQFMGLRDQIFEYFGYVEDWRVLPLEDSRECYWELHGEGPGTVEFAETKEDLADKEAGQYYANEIYTQRHLSKWVYRGEEYTMIVVDTHTNMNQFLQIFDNAKEVQPSD